MPGDILVYQCLQALLATRADHEAGVIARTPMPSMVASVTRNERKRRQALTLERAALPVDTLPSPTGEPPSRWPVSVRARAGLEGNPRARELAETAERSTWVGDLRDIVVGAKLPIVQLMSTMLKPEAALSGVGRGRRASTLRRRVLDWKRAARFLTVFIGASWPMGPGDMIDYLATLADGGASKSVLLRV